MNSIIEVFRMKEISPEARIKVLRQLGKAINFEHGAAVTNDLVDELVAILEEEANG